MFFAPIIQACVNLYTNKIQIKTFFMCIWPRCIYTHEWNGCLTVSVYYDAYLKMIAAIVVTVTSNRLEYTVDEPLHPSRSSQ